MAEEMTATAPTLRRITCAHGEPAKSVGGGMPDAVVELTVHDAYRRATVRVLLREHGGASLGLINRCDGQGNRPVEARDEYPIEYVAGVEPVELLRRATTRYGWREVTPETPWWDGQRFVLPVP